MPVIPHFHVYLDFLSSSRLPLYTLTIFFIIFEEIP